MWRFISNFCMNLFIWLQFTKYLAICSLRANVIRFKQRFDNIYCAGFNPFIQFTALDESFVLLFFELIYSRYQDGSSIEKGIIVPMKSVDRQSINNLAHLNIYLDYLDLCQRMNIYLPFSSISSMQMFMYQFRCLHTTYVIDDDLQFRQICTRKNHN